MRLHVLGLMAVLVTSLVGSGVVAEPRGINGRAEMPAGSHGGSDQLIQKMANRLELDDTQRQSVQNIHDAAKPEIDALRERMKSNRESMRALDANDPNRPVLLSEIAMEKGQLTAEGILLSDRVRSEIDAVLTDEQRAKLAEGRSMMDKRRDGRSPRNRSKGRRDRDEESIEQ